MTKKYHRLWIIFTILSILLNIGPLATYSIIGIMSNSFIIHKVALSSTIFIVAIMTAFNHLLHVFNRSRLAILLVGLYLCLDNFITPLLIVCICQMIDELIAHPLAKHYGGKYSEMKSAKLAIIEDRNMGGV